MYIYFFEMVFNLLRYCKLCNLLIRIVNLLILRNIYFSSYERVDIVIFGGGMVGIVMVCVLGIGVLYNFM